MFLFTFLSLKCMNINDLTSINQQEKERALIARTITRKSKKNVHCATIFFLFSRLCICEFLRAVLLFHASSILNSVIFAQAIISIRA